MAVAKTICDTLLAELNAFSTSQAVPDPFTAVRLRREIANLAKVNEMEAHFCSGILYTIERKAREAISEFEQLLAYNPDDANSHQNYAHSLGKLRFSNAAFDHYVIAADNFSDSTEVIIDLAEIAQVVFKPLEFFKVLERNRHKIDREQLKANLNFQWISRLAKLFKEVGITDDIANSIYSAVEQIFVDSNILIKQGYFRKTGIFGGATITFYAELLCDAETIYELNDELCDRFVENDVSHLLKDMTYIFVSHSTATSEINNAIDCSTDLTHADL